MSLFKDGPAERQRIAQVEVTIATALGPFRENKTEAMLVIFALLRVARLLLRKYPPRVQAELLPVFTEFLQAELLPGNDAILQ